MRAVDEPRERDHTSRMTAPNGSPPPRSSTLPAFASDNWAPVHPAVMAAIECVNAGSAPAYGDDEFTAEAVEHIRRHLGPGAMPYFIYTGTGANVLSLGSCVRPWEGVICAETAHIYASETGAPEWHLGTRLLTVPSEDGKLTVEGMRSRIRGIGNESRVQPRAVSITQATEFGTVYTPDEVQALADAAHAEGLFVHMDGARLANAAASLGLGLGDISSACGVDVLSFGGTKNGGLCAEAVVFFEPSLAEGFQYRRKQGMQLASKMRYVAAQFTGLLADDVWRVNAAHANAMARRLADGLAALPGVRLTQKVESNQLFAILPAEHVLALEEGGSFHAWRAEESEYRFVCSFDTAPDEVDQFLAHARRVLKEAEA